MVKAIGANATKLSKMIDDLLALARISRAEFKRATIDLSALGAEVWKEMLAAPGLAGEYRIEIQPGMTASADRTLAHMILVNLFENAVKFSPGGGTIEFGVERNRGRAAFFVRDHGEGFDLAYADRIFLPFERLTSESTAGGSGVGLANVQQAVLKHGGKVWAESAPGEGATFFFTLS